MTLAWPGAAPAGGRPRRRARFHQPAPLRRSRIPRGRPALLHQPGQDLLDTPLAVYRHAPVGTGVVPFAAVPPVLEQLGSEGLPMLEIICDQPDTEIPASVEALETMGWGRIARR